MSVALTSIGAQTVPTQGIGTRDRTSHSSKDAGTSLGVPMLVAFVAGLLISDTAIVFLSASGFVAARGRTPLYFVVGLVAGLFSLILGMAFLLGADGSLPDIQRFVGIIG